VGATFSVILRRAAVVREKVGDDLPYAFAVVADLATAFLYGGDFARTDIARA
jgi:hypothetical protein